MGGFDSVIFTMQHENSIFGDYITGVHTRTKKTSEHFFCSPDSVVAVSDPEIVQAVNFMIPALKIVMKHLYGEIYIGF